MPKLTQSQIKAVISAREREARADSKLRTAMLARMQAVRRQGEKALTAHLKKTGEIVRQPPAASPPSRVARPAQHRRRVSSRAAGDAIEP
jgi:hypothetical protein